MEMKEMKLVYETLLTAPGMEVVIKLDTRLSCRMILMLTQVINLGLESKNQRSGFLSILSEDETKELEQLAFAFLEKGGLVEMNKNLQQLGI